MKTHDTIQNLRSVLHQRGPEINHPGILKRRYRGVSNHGVLIILSLQGGVPKRSFGDLF